MKSITEIYVSRMITSKETTFYVVLKNNIGQVLTPAEHKDVQRALHDALDWAAFVGIEMTPYVDPDTKKTVLCEDRLETYEDPEFGKY